jgi:hypothetical protein
MDDESDQPLIAEIEAVIAIEEASEKVAAIEAKSQPRVEMSTTINGISKNAFLTPGANGKSPADVFKDVVAEHLEVGVDAVIFTEITQWGVRRRLQEGPAIIDVSFVVIAENDAWDDVQELRDHITDMSAGLRTQMLQEFTQAGHSVEVAEFDPPVVLEVQTQQEIEDELDEAKAERDEAQTQLEALDNGDDDSDDDDALSNFDSNDVDGLTVMSAGVRLGDAHSLLLIALAPTICFINMLV